MAIKRVKMRIEKVPGLMMDDVIIGINGVNYQIPRGKTVEVPDFVKEEYDRSVMAQENLFETENSRKYVEVAKWKNEVPGGESMNRTGLEKWNKNSGKLKAQGLSEEDFAKVWTIYSKADAEYDSNGNQTKEKAEVVMEEIGKLTGYTRTQLTALGYSVYSAKKVNAYKTW